MAQPQPQPQQRPSFSAQSQSFTNGFQQSNARPQFSPQSPPHAMSYSSPSPQPQFSPTYGAQQPPAKRPRLSPEAPSPYSQPAGTPTPQAASPVNGQPNGLVPQGISRPGTMPPPQQPYGKREERDGGDVTLRDPPNSMTFDASRPTAPNPTQSATFQSSVAQPVDYSNQAGQSVRPNPSEGPGPIAPPLSISQEERSQRGQERRDWEEARHAQHELWDPLLYTGTLNDKIKQIAAKMNLVEPQSGVLVNTQKNQPPPRVRVNGFEGATRVISDGQSILDTREKADRLKELVNLLSLGSKARLTGLIQTAARLALERRTHSQGRVPDDWTDVAAVATETGNEMVSSPAQLAGKKRSYSQTNGEASIQPSLRGPKHPAVAAFQKFSDQEIKAEQARQAKRRKRTAAQAQRENEEAAAAEQDAMAAAAAESEKKMSKKDKKAQEAKMTEKEQHHSTNKAAAMAMSAAGLFGRFGGNKKKNYSWLTGGGPDASRSPSAAPTPPRTTAATGPSKDKPPETSKGPQLGRFDEATESGIQARDLLLVLESDGRAARSFVRASSIMDGDTNAT